MAGRLVMYLHVPKTGGTTLTNILSTAYHRPGVTGEHVYDGVYYCSAGFELEKWADPEPESVTLDAIRRPGVGAAMGHFHYGLHRHTDRACAYVTLLRDPVDRMLSLHRHMQRHYHVTADLEEFVRRPPLREADNGQTRRLSGELRPIGGSTSHMLDAALEHLDEIMVVGITRRFDESLVLMSRQLEWDERPGAYYPRNVETQRPGTRDISPAVRDLIRESSQFDVALYEAANRRLDRELAEQPEGFWASLAQLRRAKEDFFGSLSPEANDFVRVLERRESEPS